MTVVSTASDRKPVRWGRIALHLGCLAALLVMLYPLAWLLATSLKPANEVIASLDLLPSHLEWSNYKTAMDGVNDVSVWRLLSNSLLIAGRASGTAAGRRRRRRANS
jgi:multiple sugar transport system permease protein